MMPHRRPPPIEPAARQKQPTRLAQVVRMTRVDVLPTADGGELVVWQAAPADVFGVELVLHGVVVATGVGHTFPDALRAACTRPL